MHSQVSGEKFLADEWRADGRPREIEELSDDFDNIGTLFIDYVMSALMREVRNKAAVGQVSPSPATLAISTLLKVGESVCSTIFVDKNSVSCNKRSTAIVSCTFWRQKTVWHTFRTAFKETGLRD